MRIFALLALGLGFAAVPIVLQAQTGNLVWFERAIPGEPPSAILVATGAVGLALVRRRKPSLEAIRSEACSVKS